MKITKAAEFKADRAWGFEKIATMQGITVNLHWTDKPYKWHVNEGQEVFVVLKGRVKMHFKASLATNTNSANQESYTVLEEGDIFFADLGEEHMAEPIGEARVLVIETQGSV